MLFAVDIDYCEVCHVSVVSVSSLYTVNCIYSVLLGCTKRVGSFLSCR